MSKEITARALRGDRFEDLDIVDMHCHYRNSHNYYQAESSMDDMVSGAARVGIKTLCVAPIAQTGIDYKRGNRLALEFVRAYPGRIYAYVGINPHFSSEIESELDKYYQNDRFIGIKIHPTSHRAKITCQGYRDAFAAVARHGGFVLTHTWETCQYCNMDSCEKVVTDFPGVNFVLAHTGGTVEGVKKTIALVNKFPNAYLDICGFDVSEHWINELVERCPINKILFGTDFPYHDVRYASSRVLFADLEDDVKMRILHDNFYGLLGKSPRLP